MAALRGGHILLGECTVQCCAASHFIAPVVVVHMPSTTQQLVSTAADGLWIFFDMTRFYKAFQSSKLCSSPPVLQICAVHVTLLQLNRQYSTIEFVDCRIKVLLNGHQTHHTKCTSSIQPMCAIYVYNSHLAGVPTVNLIRHTPSRDASSTTAVNWIPGYMKTSSVYYN